MKQLIVILTSVILYSCGSTTNGSTKNTVLSQYGTPPNAEAGKCYAKCLINESTTMGQWEEVLCGNEINKRVIANLQEQLTHLGYAISATEIAERKIDTTTKNALRSFQIDNNLPIGSMNIKTLKELKRQYNEK